jgi:hypothetical protein
MQLITAPAVHHLSIVVMYSTKMKTTTKTNNLIKMNFEISFRLLFTDRVVAAVVVVLHYFYLSAE